jgi:DNA-binding transcriptional LysR family regulator
MKIEQLFYFQQAVKYRSISVAAKQNYISQSSLSTSISRLEKELGATLLKRTSSGVEPTEFGELVLEKSEVIFTAQKEIMEASHDIQYTGTVSITCIPGAYSRVLAQTVQLLHEIKPGITLSVITAESREIARSISSGSCEFGILIYGDFLNEFHDLDYIPLFQDRYQLYVGKNSPFWERDSVTIAEILTQPYISYREEFRINNGGLSDMLLREEQPSIALRTDDLDLIRRMISLTDHVAFFPQFMEADDVYLRQGLIRAIPVAERDLSFEVGYLKSRKYRLSRLDKIVIDVLEYTVQNILQKDKQA